MIFKNSQLIFHNFAIMKKVYLDNASTTAIRPEVIQEMTKIMMMILEIPLLLIVLEEMQKLLLSFPEKLSLNI